MARVLKGSHSFTRTLRVYPLTEWTIPAFAFPAEAGTHLPTPEGWKAELALGGWLVTYRNKCPAPPTNQTTLFACFTVKHVMKCWVLITLRIFMPTIGGERHSVHRSSVRPSMHYPSVVGPLTPGPRDAYGGWISMKLAEHIQRVSFKG